MPSSGAASRPPGASRGTRPVPSGTDRPLAVTGAIAACAAAGIGIAVLTLLVLVGWIAAPHAAIAPVTASGRSVPDGTGLVPRLAPGGREAAPELGITTPSLAIALPPGAEARRVQAAR